MVERLELRASDGHVLEAVRAEAVGPCHGGLVVIQEVFGLNPHIRDLVERFARAGFDVVAPALFDRIERDVALDYDEEGLRRGREIRMELGWEVPLLDIEAAAAVLRAQGALAVIGYCWGGSLAWLAAGKLAVACAACYYGGQIAQHLEVRPRCPVMLHFGERDSLIPAEDRESIRAACGEGVEIFTYEAGHGFNCDRRPDHHPESATLARDRTLDFFRRHVSSGA